LLSKKLEEEESLFDIMNEENLMQDGCKQEVALQEKWTGKLLRACGGCLGVGTRGRAWLAAKSPDEPLSGL
jgi:hypothetical protein